MASVPIVCPVPGLQSTKLCSMSSPVWNVSLTRSPAISEASVQLGPGVSKAEMLWSVTDSAVSMDSAEAVIVALARGGAAKNELRDVHEVVSNSYPVFDLMGNRHGYGE